MNLMKAIFAAVAARMHAARPKKPRGAGSLHEQRRNPQRNARRKMVRGMGRRQFRRTTCRGYLIKEMSS